MKPFVVELLLGTIVSCSAGTSPVPVDTLRTYVVDFIGPEGLFRTTIGRSAWARWTKPDQLIQPLLAKEGVIGVRLGGPGGPIAAFYIEMPFVRGCQKPAAVMNGLDLASMIELAREMQIRGETP